MTIAIGVAVTWASFLSAILVYMLPRVRCMMSSMMSTKNRPFLPDYLPSLENAVAKKRYKEKLGIIGGLDPYEIVSSKPNNEFCLILLGVVLSDHN